MSETWTVSRGFPNYLWTTWCFVEVRTETVLKLKHGGGLSSLLILCLGGSFLGSLWFYWSSCLGVCGRVEAPCGGRVVYTGRPTGLSIGFTGVLRMLGHRPCWSSRRLPSSLFLKDKTLTILFPFFKGVFFLPSFLPTVLKTTPSFRKICLPRRTCLSTRSHPYGCTHWPTSVTRNVWHDFSEVGQDVVSPQ